MKPAKNYGCPHFAPQKLTAPDATSTSPSDAWQSAYHWFFESVFACANTQRGKVVLRWPLSVLGRVVGLFGDRSERSNRTEFPSCDLLFGTNEMDT
ncbi:hypothetical protein LZ659_16915, partial [Shewanella indica]|uniref:hypothetical protein n=1 Tax=Shewanella indica TaxID=768528 RepID=UPI001F33D640